MKSIIKIFLKITVITFLVIFTLSIALVGSMITNMYIGLNQGERLQATRMQELANTYSSPTFIGIDEQVYCDFDFLFHLNNGIKYNELQYIASHNSYKKELSWFSKGIFNLFGKKFGMIDRELEYSMPDITEQLNNGIRFMEIDVNYLKRRGEWELIVCHNPILDNKSSALYLDSLLEEINLWSKNNPGHLPITVFIEPKSDYIFLPNQKVIGIDGIQEIESRINQTFTDNLYTPKDMLRDYDNFYMMTEADDWPTLSSMLNKVLFVLFPDYNTEYMALDPTYSTQSLFMSVWYHSYYKNLDIFTLNTPFIMTNTPDTMLLDGNNAIDEFLLKNYFVRTRLDFYPIQIDEVTQAGINSGAQILTTDYPKGSNNKENYFAAFEGGYTIRLASG